MNRAAILDAIRLSLTGITGVRGARRDSYKEELRQLRAQLRAVGTRKVDAPLLARLERLLDANLVVGQCDECWGINRHEQGCSRLKGGMVRIDD